MKRYAFFLPLFFLSCFIFISQISAQFQSRSANFLPSKHAGPVNAIIINTEGQIVSAGNDGFLVSWNQREAAERYQLSPYSIISMTERPGRSQLSILESDRFGVHRISAWDYKTKQYLFTLQFNEPVSYINYSASGSFLIVAFGGQARLTLINSDTGEVLDSPRGLTGSVTLAATGRSERTMLCYMTSGEISYWDLETGNMVQRLSAPHSVRNPVIFGNNRFLGGFDSQGLLIADAVTGQILARDYTIRDGFIIIDNPAGSQFSCLAHTGRANMIYRMEITADGRLSRLSQRSLPGFPFTSAASADGENFFLGTTEGELWHSSRTGIALLDSGNPVKLNSMAASSQTIAFISEYNTLGFIPLDFTLLNSGGTVYLEDISDSAGRRRFDIITSDPNDTGQCSFLLWQTGGSVEFPMAITLNRDPVNSINSRLPMDGLPPRFNIRTAAMLGRDLLFLDTTGSLIVFNMDSGNIRFNFSAPGIMDAAFVNQDTIILGRVASLGTSPFMSINISTGETVQYNYPGIIGSQVYTGASGIIYGAVINRTQRNTETSLIRLNTSNPVFSELFFTYNGEDTNFALAESGRNFASSIGGRQAVIFKDELLHMERSAGLPLNIIDGGRYFITLDGDGNVTWHDNQTGRLVASFTLHPGSWTLETYTASGRNTIQGRTLTRTAQ